MRSFSTESDSPINSVQMFVEAVGDDNDLWILLSGREVVHHAQGRGKVASWDSRRAEVTVHYPVVMLNTYYGFNLVAYYKDEFIKEFKEISPPLSRREVFELVQANQKKAEIQETKRREAERQRQEMQKREVEKQNFLRNVREQFGKNFLKAHDFYLNYCSKHLSFEEYQLEKTKYVKLWVEQNLGSKCDFEQAAAIATIESHVQVVARAGSGKTSTLVNRALFLQKHCGIAPDKMLLLAFNKKAAEEIKERLAKQLQDSVPQVMTFHALAYALVHPEESLLYDEPEGQQSRSRAIQSVIDDHLHDPDFYEAIRALMLTYFREDWEQIARGGFNRSPQEMLQYRRSLTKEGLDGKYLKSFGEKVIADFLFEHNIKYKYESNCWWHGMNYRPDFKIFVESDQGVIIEYFGLEGDPDYDEMSERKREYWQDKPDWSLLEFFPQTLRDQGVEGFRTQLKESLENLGVLCELLSDEEIWSRIKDRAIDRFTKSIDGFIRRCRKLTLTPE